MKNYISTNCLPRTYQLSRTRTYQLPREGYKTITVKTEAFENFVNGITKAKKKDPLIENSEFLDLLLVKYAKEKKN